MARGRLRLTPAYHEGEIAVQQRAGVRAEAEPLAQMLDPVELRGGIVGFLAGRTFVVMTARDNDGTLWTSPLTGPEGFMEVTSPSDVHIAAAPSHGDPLFGLPAGQDVGLIAMEFANRRRFRINGYLTAAGSSGLSVEVEQAYGNCPQYIQQRDLSPSGSIGDVASSSVVGQVSNRLTAEDIAQIQAADTFFLGTTHPTRGKDASHRGGPSGFVRVEDDETLWWPDYRGNNMFNSLGNLVVDPTAALLFIDFATGRTLHVSGYAALEITSPGTVGDDGGTGRRVEFRPDVKTTGPPLPQRAARAVPSPRNPPITA